jgi:flagellar biosynthesis/type III secretory pathway protein FliH
LPDKNLVDLCHPIEPYQVTKNQINNLLESEDREVFMALSQSYLEWKEATKREGLQQGLQQGQRQIIENLMQVRFGELDESLIKVIDDLLKLSPMESSRLLLESSREDLIRRFLSE